MDVATRALTIFIILGMTLTLPVDGVREGAPDRNMRRNYRRPTPPPSFNSSSRGMLVAIMAPIFLIIAFFILLCCCIQMKSQKRQPNHPQGLQPGPPAQVGRPPDNPQDIIALTLLQSPPSYNTIANIPPPPTYDDFISSQKNKQDIDTMQGSAPAISVSTNYGTPTENMTFDRSLPRYENSTVSNCTRNTVRDSTDPTTESSNESNSAENTVFGSTIQSNENANESCHAENTVLANTYTSNENPNELDQTIQNSETLSARNGATSGEICRTSVGQENLGYDPSGDENSSTIDNNSQEANPERAEFHIESTQHNPERDRPPSLQYTSF